MSINDYLNKNEKILKQIRFNDEEETYFKEILGFTQKKVFSLRTRGDLEIKYQDVPISNITYIEYNWKRRNIGIVYAGCACIIMGIPFMVFLYSFFNYVILSLLLIGVGLYFILGGIMKRGILIINDNFYFKFREEAKMKEISELIQEIYFIQS